MSDPPAGHFFYKTTAAAESTTAIRFAKKMESAIDKSKIEQFRNPSEFLQWFEFIVQHIEKNLDDERNLFQQKPYKIIHQEVSPLASLLHFKAREWRDVRFKNIDGDQSYDVEIQSSYFPLSYFEIGTTTFDDGEVFRRKKLLKDPNTSLASQIIRNGKEMKSDTDIRQATGISPLPRNHSEAIEKISSRIRGRILAKSKNKNYPPRTGLIVYFDDSTQIFKTEDYERIRSVCFETETVWSPSFDKLFAVGSARKELIEI